MKNNNINRKTLSMSFKSLAFALGLVATANTTAYAMPIKEEIKTESHNHNHEQELELNEVVVKQQENYSKPEQRVYKQIAIKEISNYSISNYKGSSIVEALNKAGINSSFANRKVIAKNYGINNYRGTASQNIMLLNKLKEENISSLAKTSDITKICTSLFGKNANLIIKDLKLPKTGNITKSDFARIIRQIANYMNVDTSTYDNKMSLVLNVINDVDNTTINNSDIAWAYYMGYADIDENSNFNGNSYVSVNELNSFINSFVFDYNLAVSNNKINDNGLVIEPSQDKYSRDNLDNSKINEIRNPQLINQNSNINSNKNSSSNKKHDHKDKDDKEDNKPQHSHKFINWKYYDEENEIGTCGCGEVEYRSHTLGHTEISYTTNNDGTHNVHEDVHCNTCNREIVKDYVNDCDLTEWSYNSLTNLEERECNFCTYEETKEHVHNEEPNGLQYTFDYSNNNGTHMLKAVYNCNVCREPIVLSKEESCNFTEWKYNFSTRLEERVCDPCGYKETREHEHSQKPNDLQYTFDQSNNDGTHKLTAVYNCNVCREPITLSKDVACNFTEWRYNFSTRLEERICDPCGYKETREHEHSEEPSDLEYDIYESNNNGTHKLIAIYDCSICNQEVTLYKDANCEYGEWVKNDGFTCKKECECGYKITKEHDFVTVETTTNATLGIHNETQECDDCHYERTVEVNCTPDGNRDFYKVGDTVTEREHCSVCLDVCIDDTHTHDFGDNYIKPEGISDYHTRECRCGEIDTAVHNFTDWVVNSEGKNTRECTECGYKEEKEHQCIRNDDWEMADEAIIGSCYDEVITCTYEGCDYEFERRGHDHNYISTELPELGKIYYCCDKCYDDYEEQIPQVLSLRNILELTNEDDIYKEDLEETTEEIIEEEVEETEEIIEETEIIEEVIEETEVEEELEEIEEIKDLEPVEPELEETDNKVLVLK